MLSSFITIPLHPLFWCTVFYCFGIGAAASSAASLTQILVGCTPLFLLLSRARKLLIFFIIASFFIGMYRYRSIIDQHAQIIDQLMQGPLNCSAIVVDIQHYSKKPFKHTLTLTIPPLQNYHFGSATIQLHTIIRPSCEVGDTVKLCALTLPKRKNNQYEQYLLKEGIDACGFISKLHCQLLSRPVISVSRFLSFYRNRLRKSFKKKLSSSTFAVICPLFLGLKQANSAYAAVKKHATYWGIVHYLARSGLHVVLILSAWHHIVRFIPLNFFIKQLLLLMITLIYHVLTTSSISFLRALLTFILYKLCIFRGRSYKSFHLLTITALIVLIYNPLHLFFIDFQLSFGLTAALSWFNELNIKIQRFYKNIENK